MHPEGGATREKALHNLMISLNRTLPEMLPELSPAYASIGHVLVYREESTDVIYNVFPPITKVYSYDSSKDNVREAIGIRYPDVTAKQPALARAMYAEFLYD